MTVVKAKKHFGQHFLNDDNIAQKIVNSLSGDNQNVMEIGPGMGVLTKHLLERENIRLKLIEIDEESVEYLNDKFPNMKENTFQADFLKARLDEYFPDTFSIIGNFPYNISSQILFRVLDYRGLVNEVVGMFQMRDFKITALLKPGEEKQFEYFLLPLERGVYTFGKLNIFVTGKIGLVSRRFVFDKDVSVPVYPSFMQMRKYEMLAISDKLTDSGVKKIRKVGHQMEFDQIREHVTGDDYRTVNWKATARKAKLMVNQYMDEKSQQVYSVIDMGRVMKMPFDGLSLLDYAINSTLVLSNIALMKQDKAGLITFSKDIHTVMPPVRDKIQVLKFLEVLYNQKTDFSEPDYEKLYILIKRKISQRSLILLYTNFESYVSLERHIEYLKLISRKHVLVVVFFRNTEIRNLQYTRADSVENIYINTIAEKADFEKRMIVKELMKHGIFSILTEPSNLTINTINRYLEFKARGMF